MILALIEYDKKGSPVVVKTYLKTTHEQWIKQCSIADEAIQFQAKYRGQRHILGERTTIYL